MPAGSQCENRTVTLRVKAPLGGTNLSLKHVTSPCWRVAPLRTIRPRIHGPYRIRRKRYGEAPVRRRQPFARAPFRERFVKKWLLGLAATVA